MSPAFCKKDSVANVLTDFDNSEYLQKLGCRDVSKLGVATSEEVWEKVDLLATDRTQGEQERLDKSLGLTHCREGVLFDRALRPHVRPRTCTPMTPCTRPSAMAL